MGEEYSDRFCQSTACDSEVMKKAGELRSALIKQTLKDVDSWVRAMQTEYAKAHPDRPDDTIMSDGGGWVMHRDPTYEREMPIPEAELERYRTAVRTEYYEWVVPAFERCLHPAPLECDPALAMLERLKGMFQGTSDSNGSFTLTSPAMDRIQMARSAMEEWQGDLQQNFIQHFAAPLQRVSFGQGQVAQAAHDILDANKRLYTQYRRTTLQLLDTATKAVKSLEDSKDPKAYAFMTLVGISIGTALSIASAGIGASVIICSTLAQAYSPPSPQKVELGAPTAQEIAINVSQALSLNANALYENERGLKEALQTCHDTIAHARSGAGGALAVPTPALCETAPSEIIDGSLRPDRVVTP